MPGFDRVLDDTSSTTVLEAHDFAGTSEEFAAIFKSTRGFSSK